MAVVEAVATHPAHRRRGHGSAIVCEVVAYIDRRRPTFVRTGTGLDRTAEEDGSVLVRPTPATPPIDLAAPISCEWRLGDVW